MSYYNNRFSHIRIMRLGFMAKFFLQKGQKNMHATLNSSKFLQIILLSYKIFSFFKIDSSKVFIELFREYYAMHYVLWFFIFLRFFFFLKSMPRVLPINNWISNEMKNNTYAYIIFPRGLMEYNTFYFWTLQGRKPLSRIIFQKKKLMSNMYKI